MIWNCQKHIRYCHNKPIAWPPIRWYILVLYKQQSLAPQQAQTQCLLYHSECSEQCERNRRIYMINIICCSICVAIVTTLILHFVQNGKFKQIQMLGYLFRQNSSYVTLSEAEGSIKMPSLCFIIILFVVFVINIASIVFHYLYVRFVGVSFVWFTFLVFRSNFLFRFFCFYYVYHWYNN